MTEPVGRITVSEDKLDAKLAGLELRLVDRITQALEAKADEAVVVELRARLAAAEASIQANAFIVPAVKDLEGRVGSVEERVGNVETSSASIAAVSKFQRWAVGTVGVGVLSAIATLVWLASH